MALAQRAAWEAAVRAWSRDDCADATKTMLLGEAMMYAATDLIVALETQVEARQNTG